MGKVTGGMKCVKYLLFTFNFIFWLAGSAVLGIGLWLRFDKSTTQLFEVENSPESFYIGVYVLIAAGGLMTLVGFFGCCGAVRESQCLLGLFFISLLVIFAAEVTAGVFGFLNRETIVKEIVTVYQNAATEYRDTGHSGNETLIIFHNVLHCCGDGNRDKIEATCPKETKEAEDCITVIKEFFNTKLYIIAVVGIAIAGVMIFGMIFSMVLCCAIRNSREVI
ncbi:tetraspanin-2 [Latimeria chalumnae]|uniref:Tetraspanin n=1 Tax=Latimeria chalumnae TaxID=7897 RepID=H3BGV5_LATCH|nr:PREDICTED: tetraspanin-2 [Latimeria chalumnae]|eukprot:XP_005988529.1 PREDICTED: tetraspanin-2 [Latimeria chalumnae]